MFLNSSIYFWSFTSAQFIDDTQVGAQGQRYDTVFAWDLSGQYDIARAANDLAAAFEREKAIDKTWNRIYGAVNLGLGVLSIIPAVRVLRTGASGIRYAYAALDAALAANSIASGSTSLITGEGIDLGETMFASLEPRAIELHGSKPGDDDTGKIDWFERPSLDTNRSQVGVALQTGRANYAVMSNTLRSRLSMLIHNHGTDVRSVKNLSNVIGDAGEEAMVAAMVERMDFDPKNILGYSPAPGKIPHRIGLSNKSRHGLDVLVYVPPPPSLTARAPSSNGMRNRIDDARKPAPPIVMKFEERTLLVIETKSTLGYRRTPGLNDTQTNGVGKVDDVLNKIRTNHQMWSDNSLSSVDPNHMEKYKSLRRARSSGKIAYLHAQIFFDSNGQLNKNVGNGTGIQLNSW
ncbi:hypothetical protein [Zestomonas carbonaria]|uniref:Uncharacterized protein n=1 Tax=Zestomonas carbonaria TaxID=2762745 RepID=A0A7U7ESL3_9GAMM|nr:hypothetical protein [Pseudomonas carbonaria]CAD5110404.1 hypothetical protein PSEWESI4_04727 [Pseudomonas carbonaria]